LEKSNRLLTEIEKNGEGEVNKRNNLLIAE